MIVAVRDKHRRQHKALVQLAHAIEWSSGLTRVCGKMVRLEFQLKDAQLFGFDLQ